MQKYYDYHTHSDNSFDGRISLNESCRLAEQHGIAGLTFTEHLTLIEQTDIRPNPEYAAQITAARAHFPALEIGMGIETDLCPQRLADIEAFLAQEEWDFVLGSVHEVGGLSAYSGGLSYGHSKRQTYELYFTEVLKQVQALDCYDVLAHIDLIRRDDAFSDRSLAYADYAEFLDPILQTLIAKGKGLEVNTAGWRYGLGEAHPPLQLLQRYRALGGEIITCGSDCHTVPSVCYRIQEGYELIKAAGFRYISLFERRQVRQLALL